MGVSRCRLLMTSMLLFEKLDSVLEVCYFVNSRLACTIGHSEHICSYYINYDLFIQDDDHAIDFNQKQAKCYVVGPKPLPYTIFSLP